MKIPQSRRQSTKTPKRAGSALRNMREQFRLLVESVKEYAIVIMDPKGRVLTWNSGAERITGYGAEEIIGRNFSVFFAPEDVRQNQPEENLERAIAEGECEDEGWRVRKDSSRFWAKSVITALRDEKGKLWGFGNVTRDMTSEQAGQEELRKANAALGFNVRERTAQLERANAVMEAEIRERRRAEENLENLLEQMRSLSVRMQRLREEERKAISREVHDELGQSLTAIKMDLTWMMRRIPSEENPVRQRISSTIGLVDETVHTVRRIAAELRPGVLDDLGLAAAIEWQVQEFQTRAGITFQVRMPAEDIPLDADRSTTLFRIFQEVLRNIVQHAKATEVQVRLMRSAGMVILEIRDNGKGISEEQIANPESLGLLGMRERLHVMGGHFAIHGEEGKGTTVVVQMPLEPPTAKPGV